MSIRLHRQLLIAGTAVALTACGGGGGGGGGPNFTPTPTPSPTPTPTPTPTPGPTGLAPVNIFPGVTASTDFAALGLEASDRGTSIGQLTSDGFAVRYDSAAGAYFIDLPSTAEGEIDEHTANTPNDRFWSGAVVDPSGTQVTSDSAVLKPRSTNPIIQLTYTTLAEYNVFQEDGPFGFVAFGTATPASAVPVSGSATYAAVAQGGALAGPYLIEGDATLQFNFGAGTLSGHFDPIVVNISGIGDSQALPRYTFVNTVYSAGSPTFSGMLTTPGIGQNGTFNGLFTGPNAQELMAKWSAPFFNPYTQQNSGMFGVWIGKKP